jgi:ProP effector
MGFEQLGELQDRLWSEKVQVKTDSAKQPIRKLSEQAKPREQDPAVEVIWRLRTE